MSSFTIRKVKADDLKVIHQMILDLMAYQKLTVTPYPFEQFRRDSGLFPDEQPKNYFEIIVAEDTKSKELIGYLLYYFMIKTSSGKWLYVEDIFVKESARKTGAGSALLKEAASKAIESESSGIKLQVSTKYYYFFLFFVSFLN